MALYELGKAHFAINSDGTFRYLGRLIKKDWYNISSKQWTFKYQFSKKDGIITDTVVVNYIPGTFKELEPKIIYTAEEKVAYEKEKRGIKGMAKFKVGDRVRLNSSQYPQYYSAIGTVTSTIYINESNQPFVYKHTVTFSGGITEYYVEEKWLELVEPKVESTYKKPLVFHAYNEHDVMVGGEVRKFITTDFRTERASVEAPLVLTIKMVEKTEPLEGKDMAFNVNLHEIEGKKSLKDCSDKELIEIISKSFDDFYKNLDFTKSFPYYHLSLDEALHTRPSKNRIPDRVVFNQDKGKVTVLISKHLDGVAPYWAYTSKVHGDDKYNGYFGFMLSYYKYLNRHLGGDTRKELIDMAFQHGDKVEYIIEGAVSQEVLKLIKIDEWDNILTALLETSKQGNGYWDYLEWKEMLRVHELETKREEQKAIRKEIKKHEQEIEKLKKKGV